MKRCSACGVQKNFSEFYSTKKSSSGLTSKCKVCQQAAKNKDVTRAHTLMYTHNLTIEFYNNVLAEQNNQCKICKTDKPGTTGAWCVDHDHRCCAGSRSCGKCFRGLLCRDCNIMIGYIDKARKMNYEEILSYVDTRK